MQRSIAGEGELWAAKHNERADCSTTGPKTNIYKMVDPVRYRRGANALDRFPEALKNRQILALRGTVMTDPFEGVGYLSAESFPCLKDFYLFLQEISHMYRDNDQCHVVVSRLMQELMQLLQELVRAYANHLKANWRQAGWNLQKHKEFLYDIAWAGLCNSLKYKVGLMMPTCDRFDTLDEFLNTAAASEVTHVEKTKKPQQQQHQQPQQQQQKQPTDLSPTGSKRGNRPSSSDAADTNSSNSSQWWSNNHSKSGGGGWSSALPSARWVSKENFGSRHSAGTCLGRRSRNHTMSFCTKHSQEGAPLPLPAQTQPPNGDAGHHLKWRQSFYIEQPMDSSTSLSISPDGSGSARWKWVKTGWKYRHWGRRWTTYNHIGSLWTQWLCWTAQKLSSQVSTYGASSDWTSPILFRRCLEQNEVGKCNACILSSIAAWQASLWHWQCENGLVCWMNQHLSPL